MSVMSESIILSHESLDHKVVFNGTTFHLSAIVTNDSWQTLPFSEGSIFCFLQTGRMKINNDSLSIELIKGMYAAQKGPCSIELAPHSKLITARVEGFTALNQTGGPTESVGRLIYIDGCSDTLLISPSRLGEPCLNLLHFPENTIQTPHHHPSFRFGIVASGRGECVSMGQVVPLTAGDVFYLPAFVEHKFNTHDSVMNVIAFHPDSDWGPTDEVHPMKNRTIIPK